MMQYFKSILIYYWSDIFCLFYLFIVFIKVFHLKVVDPKRCFDLKCKINESLDYSEQFRNKKVNHLLSD